VSSRAGYIHGEAEVEIRDNPGVTAHGFGRRAGERETAVVGVPGAQGWACPHCAVENPWSERVAGDVVECDYCGSAFAPSD
jgi:ribosomal protein L37AE/L43A